MKYMLEQTNTCPFQLPRKSIQLKSNSRSSVFAKDFLITGWQKLKVESWSRDFLDWKVNDIISTLGPGQVGPLTHQEDKFGCCFYYIPSPPWMTLYLVSLSVPNKNYYAVRNTGWARSRKTWKLTLIFNNQSINQVFLERLKNQWKLWIN